MRSMRGAGMTFVGIPVTTATGGPGFGSRRRTVTGWVLGITCLAGAVLTTPCQVAAPAVAHSILRGRKRASKKRDSNGTENGLKVF